MKTWPKYLERRPGIVLLPAVLALLLVACGTDKDAAPVAAEPAAAVTAGPTGDPVSETPRTDPISGLIIDDNWELVRGTCAACHSAKLVTQNRGSRETWKSMIRWMQETQGLWALDPASENAILDYLARNYPPAASSRRAPLPPELLPENPYHKNSSS